MMKKPSIKLDDKFELLTVIGEPFLKETPSKSDIHRKRWFISCRCSCGDERPYGVQRLVGGYVKSCGCLRLKGNPIHGLSHTKIYHCWSHAKKYQVCDEWLVFENFYSWAISGWADGKMLVRKDVSLPYSSANCEWATERKPNKIYYYNESYFEKIDTSNKAYWLGLFYADGHMARDKNRFILGLQQGDRYILEKLADEIGYKGTIHDYKNKKYGSYMSTLALNGKEFTKHLKDKGVINNKTFRLTFPRCLAKELYSHFVRGLFDGDGSISIGFTKRNPEKRRQSFSIYGQKELLDAVNLVLSQAIGRSPNSIHKMKNANVCVLRYCGKKDVVKISEWLYQDASILFQRKYEKFLRVDEVN